AEVAVEGADFPDRLWALVLEAEPLIGPLDHGYWEEGNQVRLDADRSRARTAASVWGGESLVQVEVDDVEAHVAGPRHAHHGVEVRAVVIHLDALFVGEPGDLDDVLFEKARRVGIGEHHRRRASRDLAFEIL